MLARQVQDPELDSLYSPMVIVTHCGLDLSQKQGCISLEFAMGYLYLCSLSIASVELIRNTQFNNLLSYCRDYPL